MAIAHSHADGVIRVSTEGVPEGSLPLAVGEANDLWQAISRAARHAYDGETYLVPGVPEARDQLTAVDALTAFAGELGKRVADPFLDQLEPICQHCGANSTTFETVCHQDDDDGGCPGSHVLAIADGIEGQSATPAIDYYWVKDQTDGPWHVRAWDPETQDWLFDDHERPVVPVAVGPRIPRPDETTAADAIQDEVIGRLISDLVGTLGRVEDVATRVLAADAYSREAAIQDLRGIQAMVTDVLRPIRQLAIQPNTSVNKGTYQL
jgi:hypothetical protein